MDKKKQEKTIQAIKKLKGEFDVGCAVRVKKTNNLIFRTEENYFCGRKGIIVGKYQDVFDVDFGDDTCWFPEESLTWN